MKKLELSHNDIYYSFTWNGRKMLVKAGYITMNWG